MRSANSIHTKSNGVAAATGNLTNGDAPKIVSKNVFPAPVSTGKKRTSSEAISGLPRIPKKPKASDLPARDQRRENVRGKTPTRGVHAAPTIRPGTSRFPGRDSKDIPPADMSQAKGPKTTAYGQRQV